MTQTYKLNLLPNIMRGQILHTLQTHFFYLNDDTTQISGIVTPLNCMVTEIIFLRSEEISLNSQASSSVYLSQTIHLWQSEIIHRKLYNYKQLHATPSISSLVSLYAIAIQQVEYLFLPMQLSKRKQKKKTIFKFLQHRIVAMCATLNTLPGLK